jgi:acyl carrier protein
LDEAGKPVAANTVGEIAVKSRYLARGYWRRPELTQAKFLADPAGTEARLFLSGDLGYLRPDGCLVHAGRKDRQIKIRGHRVELAEVEIAVLQIVGVEQAAVVARPQRDVGARLSAYVVLRPGSRVNVTQIRAALQEKLPDYMIPSAFVPLACLPMTRSGKIDRRGLPEPPRSRAVLEVPYAAPRNPLESVLARLWSEVLQVDAIGCDDDFAALGGDSLLATRIVMQVNQMFNLTQPLKTLFATPTVAQLAAWIVAQEVWPGAAAQSARLMVEIDALTPEQIYRALGDDDLPEQNG